MKSQFLLVVLGAVVFSSCSTSYKSGQTPDDVYYSPAKVASEYVATNNTENPTYRASQYNNPEDQWLHMRVRNPYKWNTFDDYDWNTHYGWANNYSNPYYSSWSLYWTGYYSWNSYYNPYCRNVIVVNPKTYPGVYSKVRSFNPGSYTNKNIYGSSNTYASKTSMATGRLPNSGYGSYNNSNNNSGNSLGNSIRKVFSGSSGGTSTNSYAPSSERSSRSYSPSSSGSSSSGGGGGGSSRSSGGSSGGGGGRRGG